MRNNKNPNDFETSFEVLSFSNQNNPDMKISASVISTSNNNILNGIAKEEYFSIDSKYFKDDFNITKDKKRENIHQSRNDNNSSFREQKSGSLDKRKSFRLLNPEDENLKPYNNPSCFIANCYFYIPKEKKKETVQLKVEHYVLSISFYKFSQPLPYDLSYYQVSLLSIASIEKKSSKKKYCDEIEVTTKDFRIIRFEIRTEKVESFFQIINEYSFPLELEAYRRYAFWYKKQCDLKINGWETYSIKEEFIRQGINFETKSPKFRFVDNSKFGFCKSYPPLVVVPSCIDDNSIKSCASYRTKNRFPALTYQYSKNYSCIWRSSQVLGGVTGQKCTEDVNLLTTIADVGKKLFIFDARPFYNALANTLKGAGYENKKHYTKIEAIIKFCDMSNIHNVRSVLSKLYSTAIHSTERKGYYTSIENSMWYELIYKLITSSFDILNEIQGGSSVLVHCSDGWDRTTQLCATSQLLLDPYFRTLEGFIVLIEKDWVSFGHLFAYRNGNYPADVGSWTNIGSEDQRSPIFLQWLDAIYQLMYQNYTMFEFNFELLVFLGRELYNGKYGTFIYNSEEERAKANARTNTVSIWSYVLENKSLFLNYIYNKEENEKSEIKFDYKRVHLWDGYFYSYNKSHSDSYNTSKKFSEQNDEIKRLNEIIADLANHFPQSMRNYEGLKKETVEMVEKINPSLPINIHGDSFCNVTKSMIAREIGEKEAEHPKEKRVVIKGGGVQQKLNFIEKLVQKTNNDHKKKK